MDVKVKTVRFDDLLYGDVFVIGDFIADSCINIADLRMKTPNFVENGNERNCIGLRAGTPMRVLVDTYVVKVVLETFPRFVKA